jgi:signal recognition particle subunit SRP72
MADAAEELRRVEALFAVLDQQQQAFQLDKALHTCDQILALVPGDDDARTAKVSLLIHSEQYSEALRLLQSSPAAERLQFETAYCLYRLDRHAEALALLGTGAASAGVAQLRAQLQYRRGDAAGAVATYSQAHEVRAWRLVGCLSGPGLIPPPPLQLLSQSGLLESHDARTNVLAAYVSAGRADEVEVLASELGVRAEDNYVSALNIACADLALDRLPDARRHLSLAQRLGREMLMEEDDLSEAEVQAELLPVSVQSAHVAFLQGRAREAADTYTRLLKLTTADAASAAVAANNLAAARQGHDVGDSLKRLDKLMCRGGLDLTPALCSRVSQQQRQAIRGNRAAVLMLANKLDQSREVVKALAATDAQDVTCSLLQAALLVRDKKAGQADGILETAPGADVRVLLTRAQLAALSDVDRAASLLGQLPPALLHSPRVTATLLAMSGARGGADDPRADELLDQAVRYWEQQDPDAASASTSAILFAAASHKSARGQHSASAQLLARLTRSADDGVRRRAAQSLTRALLATCIEDAECNAQSLSASVPALTCDAEELDTSPLLGVAAPGAAADGRKRPVDIREGEEQSKRRKRKPRYPAGFDPAAPNNPPPDPERWLPKRERSAYKAKSKKQAKAAALRGAQGAAAAPAATTSIPAAAPEKPPAGGKKKGKR